MKSILHSLKSQHATWLLLELTLPSGEPNVAVQPSHRNHHHSGSGAEPMEEVFQQNPMIRCGLESTSAACNRSPVIILAQAYLTRLCLPWVTLLQMRLCVHPVRAVSASCLQPSQGRSQQRRSQRRILSSRLSSGT